MTMILTTWQTRWLLIAKLLWSPSHGNQYAVGCLSVNDHPFQRQPLASYGKVRVKEAPMGVCDPLRIQCMQPRALRCIMQGDCVGSWQLFMVPEVAHRSR